ncbi:MAG: DUF2164 domain-containing protein [Candidatus Magasanikbacteria bacterium CG_4_9_14_0_2_um_filter_42_11]|uniref:DUF2164 domain-containing protein n=1 Tax=Candidatus Magasanikbacteria bacterium CG_4_9_14_0_2_um_filter_42_11 TaxID=1974643 RepID=A0A2M8F917_9BACT|nr:MAG: DUF2164 domain-containing protein [Candidatus Magasanikbacteria bacterium CG10_big_fil_rev_8_21_14_0_10_43_9]PIY92646.1 MAG: DUF2164 domain-containing protein [Candidatus Magasanikbacteria bacterium CG_4_10_14_0_8_um_filter_42_12]PJC52179.1 MAG: DUF2164 domain-containing protein [Candidatus Magasanikbacteria bacterium CG_4_9_14_0_2_um_filter_42_11]
MNSSKKPWDLITKEERQYAVDKIITFFSEERDEEIGVIAAEEVLDMFLELLGPQLHNAALTEAKDWFKEKMVNMEFDFDLLKK